MKRFYGTFLVAALALAPATLNAQARGTPPAREQAVRDRNPAPFAVVLRHHAEMGLSAEQVRRLEVIGERLQAQNRPLGEQLRASGAWQGRGGEARALSGERRRGVRPEGARAQRRIPEELRPVVEQMRSNRRTAMQEARAVLTAEQQSRLRELVQQRRGGRGGAGNARMR